MSHDRPEDLASKIAAALDRIAHAQRAARQAAATHHGLTPLQIDVLTTLGGGAPPEPMVGALAVEVGVTQPTVTDSVGALERKGLARRRRDPGDGRRAAVVLTPEGRRLAAELADTDREMVAAIAALPLRTQQATLETLLTLIAELVTSGAISVARTCLTCHFHRREGDTHRCALLGIDLPPAELRINCPEHQPAAG